MRGAVLALMLATPVAAQEIARADLVEPTDRYDHAILGDALEWGALRLTHAGGGTVTVRLPETRVFEDTEARIIRLEDGRDAVLVVETDLALGASVSVYAADGRKLAATPFIGQPHRWFAPVGAADFDGDGQVDLAFVDRPHLQKDLVFARREGERLVAFARISGLTNHRIGDRQISSGIRDCGQGPEVVLANADWTRLMVATAQDRRDIGPFSPAALRKALRCD